MLRMRLELFWRTKIFNQMIWIKHEFLQKNVKDQTLFFLMDDHHSWDAQGVINKELIILNI